MGALLGFALIGLFAGFCSSLLGIGGGVIIVPALIIFFAIGPKAATATSLAYIAPVALYAALSHWFRGHDIQWRIIYLSVPAGIVGAQLGLLAKQHMTGTQIKIAFGVLMMVIGARLVLSSLHGHEPPTPASPDIPAAEATE